MERERHCGSGSQGLAGMPFPAATLSVLRLPRFTKKTYHGRYGSKGAEVWVEEFRPTGRHPREATTVRPLPLHLDVRNHSPTGFAWGYSGSGPAQLALALLLDATGDVELSLRHYQELKRRSVTGWKDSWKITVEEIHAFVARQQQPCASGEDDFSRS